LSLIKATTAPGHEQFPGFVLKKLAEALATNIAAIYNIPSSIAQFPNPGEGLASEQYTSRKEANPIQRTIALYLFFRYWDAP